MYDAICHYTFSKSIECAAPGVNCNVNWVMVMYQDRFLCCNKGTTLVRDVDNRGSGACVGPEGL